eukprot:TRINITY_DN1295_c0_g1_i1.p1 TRINITY_DN1295_c0_g1~~TRINITY_DN1295_c0_g1_i1.p1  ORF type:complete len:900 (+),score=193.43 TRINITY_DN1295_c0_g1_i1:2599-5298(+)
MAVPALFFSYPLPHDIRNNTQMQNAPQILTAKEIEVRKEELRNNRQDEGRNRNGVLERRAGLEREFESFKPAAVGTHRHVDTGNVKHVPMAAERSLQVTNDVTRTLLDMADQELDLSNEAWEEDLEKCIKVLNEDLVLAEVVSQGTNLQKYASEKEAALVEKEVASIEDYVQNADRFAQLYGEVSRCEGMIESIRNVVWGFRDHLGSITGDIKSLQQRSAEITEKIKNREDALLYLSPILQKIDVITPEWIKSVENTPIEAPDGRNKRDKQREVDAVFLQAVRQLDEKINFLSEDPYLEGSLMQQQLYPQLMSAASKVSLKVHAFLLGKMEGLKEDTNIVIQQQALAHRCSFAFRFLKHYNQSLADNIVDQYVEMINKVYGKLMRRSYQSAAKPEVRVAKPELIIPKECFDAKKGTEASGKKLFGKLTGVTSRDKVQVPFPERLLILTAIIPDGDQLVVDPSIAMSQTRTYVEDFVRINSCLINTAVHEASFISEYFSFPSARREAILTHVFDKGYAYVREKTMEVLAAAANDIIGILLLLRISECLFSHLLPSKEDPNGLGIQSSLVTSRTNLHPGTMGEGIAQRSQNRNFRPPGFLVSNLKDQQAKLWGMYSECIGNQIASVRDASEISFAKIKTSNNKPAAELMKQDAALCQHLAAHSTVKRYVDLVCDLHTINTIPMIGSRVSGAQNGSLIFSDAVVADLAILRNEMIKLITILSRRHTTPTLTSICEVNNFASVVEVFVERGVAREACEDIQVFESTLRSRVEVFALQELKPIYGPMMDLVNKSSEILKKAKTEDEYAANRMVIDADAIVGVVNRFHAEWQENFENLFNLMGQYFKKIYAGQFVLKVIFAKIVGMNQSLHTIVTNMWSNPLCGAKLVSKEVIKHQAATKYAISL